MNKKVYLILLVLCCISFSLMITTLIAENKQKKFMPPEFEKNKICGVPDVLPNYQWGIIETNNFLVGICGEVFINAEKARVYFTNPIENDVWLKLRLVDESGNNHGETGILQAGEYVEFLDVENIEDVAGQLSFKVMAYEPETYYSEGSIIIESNIVK